MTFSNRLPTSSKPNQKKIQLSFLSFPLRFVICLFFLLQEGSSFDTLPNGNGGATSNKRIGSLGEVIDDLCSGSNTKIQAVLIKFGPIKNWDVSHVTNFNYLFSHKNSFK